MATTNEALKLTFENPPLGLYKINCKSPSKARVSSKALAVVESSSIVVRNVSHKALSNGKIQVRTNLKTFQSFKLC